MNWISPFPFDTTFLCVAIAHLLYWVSKPLGHSIANISMAFFLSPLALAVVLSLFIRDDRKYALTRICFLAFVSLPMWFYVIR